jgi:hypothetical protein
MKIKCFLIGVLLLHIIFLSTAVQVQAADYSLGIKKGTEIILEVTTFDKDGLKDVFGDGWEEAIPEEADEAGLRSKILVREVDEDADIDLGILGKYDAFGIEADIWEWTDEEFEKEPDEDEFEIVWFQDPEDLNDAYDVVGGYAYDITMPFVPIDVVKFLDEIEEWKEDDDHEEWKTKDNTVIHDSIFDEETFVEVFIYDTENGFLVGYKIFDEDGVLVYEYGLSDVIPGYEIPLILGITGIFTIGLIYIMKKRNNLILK